LISALRNTDTFCFKFLGTVVEIPEGGQGELFKILRSAFPQLFSGFGFVPTFFDILFQQALSSRSLPVNISFVARKRLHGMKMKSISSSSARLIFFFMIFLKPPSRLRKLPCILPLDYRFVPRSLPKLSVYHPVLSHLSLEGWFRL